MQNLGRQDVCKTIGKYTEDLRRRNVFRTIGKYTEDLRRQMYAGPYDRQIHRGP